MYSGVRRSPTLCGRPAGGSPTEIEIINYKSLRIFGAQLLQQLFTQTNITPLTLRLLQKSYTNDSTPVRVFFFDFSQKQIGKTSFTNQSNIISELISFAWLTMSEAPSQIQNAMGHTAPDRMTLT